MILKDCIINFVLGEFPSISRCPTCENTHHHTQKEHLVEGSRSTHPWKAPHTGHPRNGELAPRASQKRTPLPPSSSATICLEKDGILSFDPKTNAEIFKNFYSNLANNLVKKLPTPPNKYGKTAVNNYYKKLNLRGKNFSFAPVAPTTILKLLNS